MVVFVIFGLLFQHGPQGIPGRLWGSKIEAFWSGSGTSVGQVLGGFWGVGGVGLAC